MEPRIRAIITRLLATPIRFGLGVSEFTLLLEWPLGLRSSCAYGIAIRVIQLFGDRSQRLRCL
jgi:hypothetical protein